MKPKVIPPPVKCLPVRLWWLLQWLCYLCAPSTGGHLFTCSAISRPLHRIQNFLTGAESESEKVTPAIDGTVQDFSGLDRPQPTTSSPLTPRGPRTFIFSNWPESGCQTPDFLRTLQYRPYKVFLLFLYLRGVLFKNLNDATLSSLGIPPKLRPPLRKIHLSSISQTLCMV